MAYRQVNVKEHFGAKGDGVTDDTEALQAAIDHISVAQGGIVFIPTTDKWYRITDTLVIDNKDGLILQGQRKPVMAGQLATGYPSSIKWDGTLGGIMMHIIDPKRIRLQDLEFRGGADGANGADTAIYVSQSGAGWGVSDFFDLGIDWCNGAAVVLEGAVDGGRNLWHRCTIMSRHTSTGTPGDDTTVHYLNCANVKDDWHKCEFMNQDPGTQLKITNGYAIYITGGSPEISLKDCYSRGDLGITAASGSGAKLSLFRHYSEDTNFLTLPAINSRQTLIDCRHISLDGGYSISAGGGSTGGQAFTIDGGRFIGDVTFTGRGPVVISNNPTFEGSLTLADKRDSIRVGRNGNYGNTSVGAINASSFVPAIATAQSGGQVYPNPYIGQILPVSLTSNATFNAPTNVDAIFDIGREFEFHITGHATNVYTVTFNSVFKLAGGAYTHSGAGKLDILTFRYNGTIWAETSRSLNITP